eukprot:PhM_4_TR414/c0_g1_i2/m.23475
MNNKTVRVETTTTPLARHQPINELLVLLIIPIIKALRSSSTCCSLFMRLRLFLMLIWVQRLGSTNTHVLAFPLEQLFVVTLWLMNSKGLRAKLMSAQVTHKQLWRERAATSCSCTALSRLGILSTTIRLMLALVEILGNTQLSKAGRFRSSYKGIMMRRTHLSSDK